MLAEHANGSLITAAHPALPDEEIVLFLVGMGTTTPPVADGAVAPADHLSRINTPAAVTIDAVRVADQPVEFAGLTPGFVGLYQVNFTIPAAAKPGVHNLAVSQGAFQSNVTKLPVGSR